MTTEGQYHDLQEILDRCLRHPVLGLADGRVTIGWASYDLVVRGERWISEYDARRHRIRVSVLLDRPWVPGYFLRDLVGHEILHSLIPWVDGQDPHTSVFLKAEARLPGHARAELWLKRNVDRLLG
jgi:hypothetical protein